MKNENILVLILKKLIKLFIISTIITIVTVIILKHFGISKPVQYCDILSYIGCGILFIGISGVLGSYKTIGDFNHQYCRTVNDTNALERRLQDLDLLNNSFASLFKYVFMALVIFIYGLVIYKTNFHVPKL